MAVLPVLFSVILFLIVYFINARKRKNLPPLAEGALPIVGHAWLGFVKNERLYEIMAKTVLGSSLRRGETLVCLNVGTWNLYACLDPDDGYLLVNSCHQKDTIYDFFHDWIGNTGLLTSDVSTWRRHRKLLNPTFSQTVVDSYLVEFNDQAREMVKLLTQEAGKGLFNQMPYLKQTILQIACATLMGVNVNEDKCLIKRYGKACDIYTFCMAQRLRKFYYHSDFLFNLSKLKKTQDAAVKCLREMSYEVLKIKKATLFTQEDKKEQKDSSKGRYRSLLDFLLEMESNGVLTNTEVLHEVHTFIGGAFDTTNNTLGTVLLTIGSYPDVQQKIFDELQEVFEESARDVEKQDMSRLKYLDAVIKETMRLYPVAAGLGRILDKELKFKNYTLPAGSRCYMSIYHLGRHQAWGPDAEQFRPERWLDGSLPTNTKAYAVFGLGRRNCIGSHYGMTMMKTILSHVLRRFRISGDVTQLVQLFDVFVIPAYGHHISIQERRLVTK